MIWVNDPKALRNMVSTKLIKDDKIELGKRERDVVLGFFEEVVEMGTGENLISRFNFIKYAKRTVFDQFLPELTSTQEKIDRLKKISKAVNFVLEKFMIDSIPHEHNEFYIINDLIVKIEFIDHQESMYPGEVPFS